MPLDRTLLKRMQRALARVDEQRGAAPRLVDDASRLWHRALRLIKMNLAADGLELDALELSTLALQLPLRRSLTSSGGKPARTPVRDRAEDAAELLVGLVGKEADERLLDRTTRILHEMPHRSPMLDEAKILADALNLEDFGVTGLVKQIIQLSVQGEGLLQFADGCRKRDAYGYWEARLRDGFHFDSAKQIARQRLDHSRQVFGLLSKELQDDAVEGY